MSAPKSISISSVRMSLAGFEQALVDARARLDIAGAALREKHAAAERDDYRAAYEALLHAERALASARGEEHAVFCPGFPAWNPGAPLPHLVTGGSRGALLVYLVHEPDPSWDGRNARIVDVGDTALVATVRFTRVTAVRMGAPNDEVIEGHPLHGKGLAAYSAHVIERSRWIEELRAINAVHPRYDPQHWTTKKHYFLAFHDEVLECVAEGFDAETKRTTLAAACRDALEKVINA